MICFWISTALDSAYYDEVRMNMFVCSVVRYFQINDRGWGEGRVGDKLGGFKVKSEIMSITDVI